MHGFVSHFTNRVDAKGRVSIPAPFRSVLAGDGYEGLYVIPSPHVAAIDAGGNALLKEITTRLDDLTTLTAEHDMASTMLFGFSDHLKIDGEGRVVLNDMVREAAGIEKDVTFVGLGYKFQIWEPARFAAHRAEAMRRTLGMLGGGRRGSVE